MSQLEDRTIDLLKQILGSVPIRREVNVKQLFPNYISGRDRYDIVIPSLNIIVECHGAQHGQMVSFGHEDPVDTLRKFQAQKRRDNRKQEEAEQNGWSYVCIWYDELNKDETHNIVTLKQKLLESI